MTLIKIIKNIHDGFNDDHVPVFHRKGDVLKVDGSFIAKWEHKKAFELVDTPKVVSKPPKPSKPVESPEPSKTSK